MKTIMKFATVISLLTISLVTTSWASPRSKLSYEGFKPASHGNCRAGSCQVSHRFLKHVGPRSKM